MDETPRSTGKGTGTTDTSGWTTTGEGPEAGKDRAKEWVAQLQAMIDSIATHAAPVVREVGAKAAELAALAGEKAGPIAHKAADVTEAAGHKVAERGREVAAELRRDAAAANAANAANTPSTGDTTSTRRVGTAVATPPADTTRSDVAGE